VLDRDKRKTYRVWWRNLKKRDRLEVLGIHDVNIKMGLNEVGLEVVDGFVWLRMGTSGGLYCTR
jgi:hypothetical protein